MSDLSFDDLIPSRGATPQNGALNFEDLVPRDPRSPDRSHPDYFRGMIIPRERDGVTGETSWAVPRILDPVIRSVQAPGEAMRGELQVIGDDRRPTDEAIARSLEFGATMAPASAGMARGTAHSRTLGEAIRRRPDPPTAQQLRQAASSQYDQMRATGATYAADDIARMAQETMVRMNQEGFNDATSPRTFRILQQLSQPREGQFGTIDGLQAARRTFGQLRRQALDPTEGAAAGIALRGLDEFIQAPVQSPTTAQTGAAGLLRTANANHAAASRSREIGGIERASELRAAAANSGNNLGNTIRQRVTSALTSRRPLSGYSDEELRALEQIIRGTFAQNASRDLGSFLGGGGGIGAQQTGISGAGVGALLGAPVGAAVEGATIGGVATVGLGAASRALSNALTSRALRRADDMIRGRSPLYQDMLRRVPQGDKTASERLAVIRAMIALELSRIDDRSPEATTEVRQ